MDPLGINTPDLSVCLLVNELIPNRYAQRVHRLAERSKFDILEPAVSSVVLQADITSARVLIIGNVEFVRGAVGPLIGFRKLYYEHIIANNHSQEQFRASWFSRLPDYKNMA